MLALLSLLRGVCVRSRHDPRALIRAASSSSAQRLDRNGKGQSTPSRPALQPRPPPPRNANATASRSGVQSGRRETPRASNAATPIECATTMSPKPRLPLQLSAQPWLRRHALLSDFDRSTSLAHAVSLPALPACGSVHIAASTSARPISEHPVRVLAARFRAALDLAPPWPHFDDAADGGQFTASPSAWSTSPLSDASLENPVLGLSLADFRASCANVRQHAWTAQQYAPTRFHSYTGAADGGQGLGMRTDLAGRQSAPSASVYENAHAALGDSRAAHVNAARAAHTRGRLDEVYAIS